MFAVGLSSFWTQSILQFFLLSSVTLTVIPILLSLAIFFSILQSISRQPLWKKGEEGKRRRKRREGWQSGQRRSSIANREASGCFDLQLVLMSDALLFLDMWTLNQIMDWRVVEEEESEHMERKRKTLERKRKRRRDNNGERESVSYPKN